MGIGWFSAGAMQVTCWPRSKTDNFQENTVCKRLVDSTFFSCQALSRSRSRSRNIYKRTSASCQTPYASPLRPSYHSLPLCLSVRAAQIFALIHKNCHASAVAFEFKSLGIRQGHWSSGSLSFTQARDAKQSGPVASWSPKLLLVTWHLEDISPVTQATCCSF
jgi:hypothetical protein